MGLCLFQGWTAPQRWFSFGFPSRCTLKKDRPTWKCHGLSRVTKLTACSACMDVLAETLIRECEHVAGDIPELQQLCCQQSHRRLTFRLPAIGAMRCGQESGVSDLVQASLRQPRLDLHSGGFECGTERSHEGATEAWPNGTKWRMRGWPGAPNANVGGHRGISDRPCDAWQLLLPSAADFA